MKQIEPFEEFQSYRTRKFDEDYDCYVFNYQDDNTIVIAPGEHEYMLEIEDCHWKSDDLEYLEAILWFWRKDEALFWSAKVFWDRDGNFGSRDFKFVVQQAQRKS
jgi:hypothetical protein